MSMPDCARTTPVTPPTLNKKMNPNEKRIGAFNSIELPHRVASQLKILIPVGIAITIVAAVKYILRKRAQQCASVRI
jgi:cellobiose-specific phosphotransferase system component IIC